MITVDNRSAAGVASRVEDLHDVSLEDLATERGAIDEALLRVLPDQSTLRVPVAAFNSSI